MLQTICKLVNSLLQISHSSHPAPGECQANRHRAVQSKKRREPPQGPRRLAAVATAGNGCFPLRSASPPDRRLVRVQQGSALPSLPPPSPSLPVALTPIVAFRTANSAKPVTRAHANTTPMLINCDTICARCLRSSLSLRCCRWRIFPPPISPRVRWCHAPKSRRPGRRF